ncbi:homocysteine S-methyltransferase family protein [Ursidibacter arcticus]
MANITILDGGMGRELARRKVPFQQPEWSALALYQQPSAIQLVHEDFIISGADIITTNSYAIVPFHIGETRFLLDSQSLANLSGELAQKAVKNRGKSTKIAGSIPPLFGSYRPDLFDPKRVEEIAKPIINGLSNYADFWLCETQSSIIEPQSIKPLLPNDDRPMWVSFTLQDEKPSSVPCLRSGESVEQATLEMIKLGVKAILFNCCQPEVIENAVQVTKAVLSKHNADIRIGAYANAFPPQPENATANDGLDEIRDDLDPISYLNWAKKWVDAGATIIGGCCGIGPEHIKVLSEQLTAPI